MGIDNAAIARRFMSDVWGKGDERAIAELVHPDIEVKDTMGTDMKGIDKVKEMIGMMKSSFSSNTFAIDDIIVAGDRVVVRATWQGTHIGDFFGVKATGKTISNQTVDILRIRDGKVVEDIGYVDTYTMFQQMGALPARDQLATSPPQPPAGGARPSLRQGL